MVDWFRKQPKINTPAPQIASRRLPQLPALPPKPAWVKSATPTKLPPDKQGASAKVVMHHFARSEVRNLTAQAETLHGKVVAKLRTLPEFANFTNDQLVEVIRQLTFRLQTADLTVNFKASSWFRTPNQSRTYQQMYERGAQMVAGKDGGQELRIAGNAMNKVDVRDAADTRVTFGANVNTLALQGVARFMQTGGLTETDQSDGTGRKLHAVSNKNFNPRARQNFAALNYARRGSGPAPEYGESLLILNENLKKNAVYYMGDTFNGGITAADRVSYGMLFAVILQAEGEVLRGVIDSCYRCIFNPPEESWNGVKQMIEAHIFEEIRFSSDVKMMVLKPDFRDQKKRLELVNNAKVFCNVNGIRLVLI
jgi:hypothetical protein